MPDAPARSPKISLSVSVGTQIVQAVFILGYPLAMYTGLTRWSPMSLAFLVGGFALVRAVAVLWSAPWEHARAAIQVPATAGVLAVLAAVVGDGRCLLALPSFVNLVLFGQFAITLRKGVPIVERFARLQVTDLSPEEQVYCRSVTVAWCAFFVANGLTAALLAIWAPLRWWTVYTGVISYGLMGAMFAVEYAVRKYRFRRYGHGFHDRLLARLLPPQVSGS